MRAIAEILVSVTVLTGPLYGTALPYSFHITHTNTTSMFNRSFNRQITFMIAEPFFIRLFPVSDEDCELAVKMYVVY